MNSWLPGGAGPALESLVKGWYQTTPGGDFLLNSQGRRQPLVTAHTNDFAVVNLGQLKTVAKPFYDRLIAVHYQLTYPWQDGSADDFAAGNLGQLKNLFSFGQDRDSDQDGIPDWWENLHGLSPSDPNDAFQISRGGALTNIYKYENNLNPEVGDSDGDGVDDDLDLFPTDERRSSVIPPAYFSATDLGDENSTRGGSIAIDNTGHLAWATQEDWLSKPIRVVTWKDGEKQDDNTVQVNDPDTPPNFDPNEHAALHGVLPNGTAYGSTSIEGLSGTARFFTIASGTTSILPVPSSYESRVHDMSPMSDSGIYSGWGYQFGSATDAVWFVGPSLTILSERFVARVVSRSGVLAGASNEYDPRETGGAPPMEDPRVCRVWSSDAGFNSLPGEPYGVNDQREVVGLLDPALDSSYDDDGYPLGFMAKDGASQKFTELLPKEFKKQLRSAIPYYVSNDDSESGKPTVLFQAESLEGDSTGDWHKRTFLLSWIDTDSTAVRQITIPPDVNGGDKPDVMPRMINDKGTAVAFEDTPKLLHKTEFQAINILRGFDLPVAGDRNTPTGPRDQDHPEWWTSVIADPSGASAVNNNIQFVYNDGEPADIALTASAQDSSIHVGVTGSFKTGRTAIPISAASASDGDRHESQVIIKNPQSAPIARLKVDILPRRTITLGLYYLRSTKPDAPAVPEAYRNPTAIKNRLNEIYESQAGIHFEIAGNAGVDLPAYFERGTVKDGALDDISGIAEIPYVKNDFLPLPNKVNLLLVNKFLSNPAAPQANLAITPGADNRSIVRTDAFDTRGFDDFLTTCAHEIGHQLQISQRNPLPPGQERNANHNHDNQYFPVRYYYEAGAPVPQTIRGADPNKPEGEITKRLRYGLMTQGTPPGKWAWIRNEDWKKANDTAKDFQ